MTDEANLSSILFLGALSSICFVIGRKREIFSLSSTLNAWIYPIKLYHVLTCFGLYLITLLWGAPLLAKLVQDIVFAHPNDNSLISYITWLQFSHSLLTAIVLFGFLLLTSKEIKTNIWVQKNSNSSCFLDLTKAFEIAILSFPIIGFSNQIIDFSINLISHIREMPDQLAIKFLKMTFGQPLYLSLSVSTIVIFAPLIEELLFRGFLQSYIRQHLGSMHAIIITSLVFALYHYAPQQGVTNFTIIGSIFVCSCFFGLIYEKRRSLKASIFMHSIFNTVNVCNLYFLGGIPGGYL